MVRKPVLLLLLIALVVALVVGSYGPSWFNPSRTQPEFEVVEEAWQVIINDYVDSDEIDLERLSQGAIEGMIKALDDPYSAYFDAEQYELSQYSLQGSFGGVGIEVTVGEEGGLVVVAPIVGTPAQKAGIMPGDKILAIDGEKTEGMHFIEAVLKIRGEQGTQVTLRVLHEGEDVPQDYVITREEIDAASVLAKMLPGNIAHIEVGHFTSRTGSELTSALEDIIADDVSGIILDLRDNPGGVLKAAVAVASQFLEEGIAVYVIDGEGNEEEWRVEEGGLATKLPLVVLVNSNSASSSEVVAGALQDHMRGIVIGTQTLGKGAVNHFRELSDGSAVYITSARWYTPNRQQIEGQGITPDEIIEITEDDLARGYDPQLERAIEYIESQL
ncbi:MAG: S41 family peptidase [Dehalococcoidia bacterium]|nr:S41 family peptidase [Dehalococcoidia bacterium]